MCIVALARRQNEHRGVPTVARRCVSMCVNACIQFWYSQNESSRRQTIRPRVQHQNARPNHACIHVLSTVSLPSPCIAIRAFVFVVVVVAVIVLLLFRLGAGLCADVGPNEFI